MLSLLLLLLAVWFHSACESPPTLTPPVTHAHCVGTTFPQALNALKKALEYVEKSTAVGKERQRTQLQQRVYHIEQFVAARSAAKEDPSSMVRICHALLEQVRRSAGSCLAFLCHIMSCHCHIMCCLALATAIPLPCHDHYRCHCQYHYHYHDDSPPNS